MNNDRELLELAAKAGNIKGRWMCFRDNFGIGKFGYPPWNSLHNPVDCNKLAEHCNLNIIDIAIKSKAKNASETRRAITRAAAEIGKAMG